MIIAFLDCAGVPDESFANIIRIQAAEIRIESMMPVYLSIFPSPDAINPGVYLSLPEFFPTAADPDIKLSHGPYIELLFPFHFFELERKRIRDLE